MKYKIIIIGAGVVGLAIAWELSKYHKDIAVIEKWGHFGEETSSRNSEVIHAGIYYPKNSLKAKLCVSGNQSLYDFAERYSVPYNKCGKLIVATTETEIDKLENIYNNANELGARDLRVLNQNETLEYEKNIVAYSSILSPNSGIIDSHSLMQSLEALSISNNVDFIYNYKVTDIFYNNNWKVKVCDAENYANNEFEIESEILINSAGLSADKIAQMIGLNTDDAGYTLNYAKGHYFKLSSKFNNYVKKLIYPIPPQNTTGLGIHITLDMGGSLKLGPDVHYLDENIADYTFIPDLKSKFYIAVNSYLKNISIEDLSEDYTGIRPKIQKQGEPQKDFIIKKEDGYNDLINLIGIESPGLTCSLEIGKYVRDLI
jgi:L-2-hydroxyglutarate oxidase LhgO